MAAYFQMGHDTENLVGADDLGKFRGIVLSPVNREPEALCRHVEEFRELGSYDIVLDPQLYFPRSDRGPLRQHPYFPSDFETADYSSDRWWDGLTLELAAYCRRLCVSSVASPCILPRTWSNDYYLRCARISDCLCDQLDGSGVGVWATVMIGATELGEEDRPMEIASIVSDTQCKGYYLVLVSDVIPRREIADETGLCGMMGLIRELENTGRPVLVSHCSSDMLLFKAAGASHCASGKFFNLRRFTKSRYEEPAGGGGQLPYWFEQSLLAFLREADVVRLQREGHGGLLETESSRSRWSREILEQLATGSKKAWLALSWRQYLAWFGNTESQLGTEAALDKVRGWLREAEQNWRTLDEEDVLFDEPQNDGSWVRPWRQAVAKFRKAYVK